eukprot:TRINITY_DN329_c0_g1_i1.p1 TRINITY_DN329_c0_g1~~TRINITY_DN329_c0_g1_i1.p1  ORF type:complete len:611 (-),score=207.90 TRINITY_DN329_c0_g1_i1:488-2173(-)
MLLSASFVPGKALFGAEWWQQARLSDAGGGTNCAVCTLGVTLLEQLSVIHDKPIEKVFDEICGYFPAEFQSICVYLVNTYGDELIAHIVKDESADDVCHNTGFCTLPTCRLFTETAPATLSQAPSFSVWSAAGPAKIASQLKAAAMQKKLQNLGLGETPWAWIEALIARFGTVHEPSEDVDNDLYSDQNTMRGAHWRGRDCDDLNSKRHAGVLQGSNPFIDENCNGIVGANGQGQSYETLLCGSSGQLGVIVVGDSGGAHFEIPPAYLNASAVTPTTYSNLLGNLLDEFDLPQLSGYTGYANTSEYSSSMYKYLRERNLCNHRDFQNCAVNGVRSSSMNGGIIQAIARNVTLDQPALLFFELIGNDICNPHPDINRMTTPAEFLANVLESLNYLDHQLPKGSHVVFIGLAPGAELWDLLNNRTHPIGATYREVYDFLNCLEISPCWMWMNSNATVREAGTTRANELNLIYPQIIANYTFNNFDMAYYAFPFADILAEWTAQGGEGWQLIEPIDGFHPNQIAHSLMADYYYKSLLRDHPSFLGPINPNNTQIAQLFGDQGGY